MFWNEGEDRAPPLVKLCIRSWRTRNPGWEVRVVDMESYSKFCDLADCVEVSRPDISIVKFSDLLRLRLLSCNGGVWADATLFCVQPLDQWLSMPPVNGFFAFRDPGVDRLMDVWFMASVQSGMIISELELQHRRLYTENIYSRQHTWVKRFVLKWLRPVFSRNPNSAVIWVGWFFRRVIRVHPYYNLHYLFTKIVNSNRQFEHLWSGGQKLEAHQCLKLLRHEASNNITDALSLIEKRGAPVFKLNRKKNLNSEYWMAVLGALERSLGCC